MSHVIRFGIGRAWPPLAALCLVCSAITIPAQAQSPGAAYPGGMTPTAPATDPSSADFAKLDTNHDGYISRQEARKDKKLSKLFDSLDTNKDGKLDPEEFARYAGASGGSGEGSTMNRQMGNPPSP